MGVSCKNCGGTDIDNDPARGDAVCINCGSVIESLCIVNEIEFQENSAGNASVIGQFVSADGNHRGGVGAGYKYSLGRDHRQATLDNGKRIINQLGSQLKMTNHCLDSAFMFYKMAVSKRFTSGRRTIQVIGACLYLVSRTEKTPHMLLDICDVVQCDVVTLGRVFLQLARELCIDCPIVDPSLYIHRFAHQLDFGDKENEVSMAALRIMARMKKDWIHFGRRPSALCGAALIIAARLFNFDVTMKDIVKLVRMSKTTVFKRLMDFSKTATGKLTTDEFKTVDLEEEADPPCYTEGRNRVKFAQEISGQYNFVSIDVLAQVTKTQEKLEELLDKRKSIHNDIEDLKSQSKSFDYRKELPQDYSLYSYELDENGEFKAPKFIIHKEEEDENSANNKSIPDSENESNQSDTGGTKGTIASSTLLLDQSRVQKTESEEKKNVKTETVNPENDEICLDDIDDNEIDQLLLTEDEIKIKTEVWLEENRDYLIRMKEKEEERKKKEEEDSKLGVIKKKRVYKRKHNKNRAVCDTADEAIKTMLAEKKLSSKINYDVLRGLKSETSPINDNIQKFDESLAKDCNSVIHAIQIDKEHSSTERLNNSAGGTSFASTKAEKSPSKKLKIDNEERELLTDKSSGAAYKTVETEENLNEFNEEPEMEDSIITASSLFAKEIDYQDDDDYTYDDDVESFY